MISVRVSALLIPLAFATAAAQAQTAKRAPSASPGTNVFEDDEVRVPIPAGWKRTLQLSPSTRQYPSQGTLLLEKDGYTLTLAYVTGQASGIIGGRIIEEFGIPWSTEPKGDQWACAGSFAHVPQAADRTLIFENLIVDTTLANTREACAVRDLTDPSLNSSQERYTGGQRWFGGYFTPDGGYFFGDWPGDSTIYSRSYSLTTSAQTVDKLPSPDNPHLAEIIQQAIDIVDSIQYKKHPLRPVQIFRID